MYGYMSLLIGLLTRCMQVAATTYVSAYGLLALACSSKRLTLVDVAAKYKTVQSMPLPASVRAALRIRGPPLNSYIFIAKAFYLQYVGLIAACRLLRWLAARIYPQ